VSRNRAKNELQQLLGGFDFICALPCLVFLLSGDSAEVV
jgi:hypothetical protein